jgi:hypothetical protein
MLREKTRYSIVCDDCGTSPCPDGFEAKEEAEQYGVDSGMIRAIDGGDALCHKCRARGKKCIVKGCTNHNNEGSFVDGLCSPCHAFVADGTVNHSQACRNAIEATDVFLQVLFKNVKEGKFHFLNGELQIR